MATDDTPDGGCCVRISRWDLCQRLDLLLSLPGFVVFFRTNFQFFCFLWESQHILIDTQNRCLRNMCWTNHRFYIYRPYSQFAFALLWLLGLPLIILPHLNELVAFCGIDLSPSLLLIPHESALEFHHFLTSTGWIYWWASKTFS